MPCRDYDDDPCSRAREALAQRNAMLCEAMRFMEASGTTEAFFGFYDAGRAGVQLKALRRWWKEHKAVDQAREREERLRESALAKLTPEELKVLGLKE